MALYPEYTSVSMAPTVSMRIRFKTLRSSFDQEGEENRKQKWLYPKRDITVRYNNILKDDAETLWAFYIARAGSYGAFNFFLPEPQANYPSYTGEYVGTGDGSTTVFNLPCKTSSSRTVYVDSVSQVEDTDYTFSDGGGADGADQITFDTAPADGERITIDFTGILKIHCVFAEDYFDFDTWHDRLVTSGVELRGLLNE